MGIEITDDNFQAEILDFEGWALVDVSAEWCGPCKLLSPIVREIAEEMAGRLKVAEADVDAAPTMARNYRIQAVPTLLLFKNGELVDQRAGAMPKPRLKDWLNSHLPE